MTDQEIGEHLATTAAHLRALAERAKGTAGRTALLAGAEMIDRVVDALAIARAVSKGRH